MQKLLCLKNPENVATKQKFVFKGIETPPSQTSSSGGSLTQRLEKKINFTLNVDTNFSSDANAVFDDLGKKAAEKNPALSAESLKKNLNDTLAPGKTIDQVWSYLQDKQCQTAAIVDGHLKFFAGSVGTNEIQLFEFYKPLELKIGGDGTLTNEYLIRRQEMMTQSMQALQDLRAKLPEVPPSNVA